MKPMKLTEKSPFFLFLLILFLFVLEYWTYKVNPVHKCRDFILKINLMKKKRKSVNARNFALSRRNMVLLMDGNSERVAHT